MRTALACHDALLRTLIENHNGYVFKTVGDAFCAAFPTAADALLTALETQFAFQNEPWDGPVKLVVRMGLHTGEAEERDNDYFGPTLNRVARLQSLAAGGQILLSQATYELVRDHLPEKVGLHPLGMHRLKDLTRPEQVHMVRHPELPADFPPLKSLDSLPNNLPIQLTSFIGREKEMAAVTDLLTANRLVTLLGTGGTGKTRLSLQTGAELLERFQDGVYFVELAPVTEANLLAQTVASVLGVKEEVGRPLTQSLVDYLKPRTLLLILDNCEHLVAACARLAQTLLQSCPLLSILASSRESFNIPGETIYRVPSLRLPDPKKHLTIASLSQYEAVRLFIDRATSIQSTFTVTNANVPALTELCIRLDGIPLAIELAAARVRSLSIEEINNKLNNVFRLLTGGSRTALPRQQTLRALIDWSYDLLSAVERMMLSRLSVFAGGWTLEAAEAVCVGDVIEDWEVLDLLTSLADKSLVVTEEQDGHTRYRLLETIRQYAVDRLRESGAMDTVAASHQAYFQRFSEETSKRLNGAEQQDALEQMEREHGNLRAALEWAVTHRPEIALPMAVEQGLFWYIGGYLREGREQLEQALAVYTGGKDTKLHADAYYQIGRLAVEQNDFKAANQFLEDSLALFRKAGNTRAASIVLNSLGTLAVQQNRYSAARAYLEESLSVQREMGTQAGTGAVLTNLGNLLHDMGDYEKARATYDESLSIYEQLNHPRGIATNQINLSNLLYALGDVSEARTLANKSLAIGQQLKDDWYIAYSQCSLAAALKEEGDYATAETLAQEALIVLRNVGDSGQMATALLLVSEITFLEKDYAQTAMLLQEHLQAQKESGQARETIMLLELFVRYTVTRMEDAEERATCASRAAQLLGFTRALRNTLAMPLPPICGPGQQQQEATLQEVLGTEAFSAAQANGAALTREAAIALALTSL